MASLHLLDRGDLRKARSLINWTYSGANFAFHRPSLVVLLGGVHALFLRAFNI